MTPSEVQGKTQEKIENLAKNSEKGEISLVELIVKISTNVHPEFII